MGASDNSGEKITPKPAFQGSIDMVMWAIIAIQIIVGVYGFVVLPNTVPIHWGLNGQPNGYGPKWVDTFLFPPISIGVYILVRVLIAAGPRLGGRESTAANLRVVKIILVGVMLFMLIIQLSTIALGLGFGFDITMIVTLALSVLFIFLGNYMGKLRRNFWAGIRTPWTLASDVVWERTHRFGGWLFVIGGLLGVIMSFIPVLRVWGFIVVVVAIVVILYAYSYIAYQRYTVEGHEPLSPPFDNSDRG